MSREQFVSRALLILAIAAFAADAVLVNAKAEPVQRTSQNDRIAEACTPAEGERRVIEWQVDGDGNKTLVVTSMKFIGTRKGTTQYAILESSEIQ